MARRRKDSKLIENGCESYPMGTAWYGHPRYEGGKKLKIFAGSVSDPEFREWLLSDSEDSEEIEIETKEN